MLITRQDRAVKIVIKIYDEHLYHPLFPAGTVLCRFYLPVKPRFQQC